MRRLLCLIAALVLLHSAGILAQQRLGFFVGVSDLLGNGPNPRAEAEQAGITTGFLIPINFSDLKIFYKVRMSYHNADYPQGYGKNYDKLLQFANTILVGKEFPAAKLTILPQLGFGAANETIFDKWDSGYGSADLFFDFSLIVRRDFHHVGVGVMANYQTGLIDPGDQVGSGNRLFFTLLLAL